MITILSQNKKALVECDYVWISGNAITILGNDNIVLGHYSTPEKTERVFNKLIEFKENRLCIELIGIDKWRQITHPSEMDVLSMVFKMPLDEEVD